MKYGLNFLRAFNETLFASAKCKIQIKRVGSNFFKKYCLSKSLRVFD